MTPRERWLAVLKRQAFDRVPLDYRATTEFTTKLLAHLNCQSMGQVYERLHIDPVVDVGPRYVGPPAEPGHDIFGVGYQEVDYGSGSYSEAVYHPLAQFETVAEIEVNYQWPQTAWWDYSDLKQQVVGHEEQVIRGGHCEEFAAYKYLRGVTQGYMDLIDKPDMVHYVLGKLYDLKYDAIARIYEALPGQVVWSWVAEDVGTQEGLMISLQHIREYFLPHMKRIIEVVHHGGGYAFHHSDGAVRANVPQMIETGIDVLDPVQWRCKGMEREGLKADFGDQVIFHGALDNQFTLPFGTVEDCRQEAVDNIRILGAGGGLILGPCHNIQSITPPENVVAAYDAAYEAGWQ